MKTIFKFLLSGSLVVTLGSLQTMTAAAGVWDRVNQVTGAINNTSSKVDQVNNAKNQVQNMGSKLPKPAPKNKQVVEEAASETESPEGFELTKTNNPIQGEWGTQQKQCPGGNSATCSDGLVDMMNC